MRKFVCPFCDYVHIFAPKGRTSYKKRITGYTCPGCGKKPTEDDYKRARAKKKRKGETPELGEKRKKRKRKKQDVQPPEFKPRISEPPIDMTPIEWKTPDSSYRPPSERRAFNTGGFGGRRDNSGWQQIHAPHPTGRSLGEAAMGSLNISPSGPIPRSNPHSNPRSSERSGYSREDRESLEEIIKTLDREGRKLGVMIATMSNIEGRVDSKTRELDSKTRELDSKLQAMSTLLSRMEEILSHYKQLAAGMK